MKVEVWVKFGRSILECFCYCGFVLELFVSLGCCAFHWFQVDGYFVDFSGEFEGNVVGEIDWGSGVLADVEAFVQGVAV